MSVREWWARAHYALEEYFRDPSRPAEAGFWAAVLLLYASVEWTLRAGTPVAGAGIGAIAREILAIALLLPLVFALAGRLSRQPVATRYLLHACAALAFAHLVSAAALGPAIGSDAFTASVASLIALYVVLVVSRWSYERLRGPEPQLEAQLALDLVREPAGGPAYRDRFVVRRRGREIVVPASEVNWIQAAGREVVLHLGSESVRVRESMLAVEQSLDPRTFVRVHRSRIVNLDRIRAIYPWAYGDFRIVMQDGTVVNFSRIYRSRLDELHQPG